MANADSMNIPGLVHIQAAQLAPPPAWALLPRRPIALMEQSAVLVLERYQEASGRRQLGS